MQITTRRISKDYAEIIITDSGTTIDCGVFSQKEMKAAAETFLEAFDEIMCLWEEDTDFIEEKVGNIRERLSAI